MRDGDALDEPITSNPYDTSDHVSEAADVPVKGHITPTLADILDRFADQADASKSEVVRESLELFMQPIIEDSPELFTASHLNYLARKRLQRDRKLNTRIDTFYRRVDDTIQNRLSWDTEPSRLAHVIRSFQEELRYDYEAGYLEGETYEKRLRYLTTQFQDYEPAQSVSVANREDRSAAFSMTGPKYSQEYREELGHAIGTLLRGLDGASFTINKTALTSAHNFANEAARKPCTPADKTERDVWADVKLAAIEATDTQCEERCLLDQAADLLAAGKRKHAHRLCQTAADLDPNSLDRDVDEMMQKAESRADGPAPDTETASPTQEPAVDDALRSVQAEADRVDAADHDATGEVASTPPTVAAATPQIADADGGRTIDGEGQQYEPES